MRLYTDRAPLCGLKSLSVCHVRVMCANYNRYYDIIHNNSTRSRKKDNLK